MFHIVTHDSHGGEVVFDCHLLDLSQRDLLSKLLVEQRCSTLGIAIAHTDRDVVLRRGLRDQEYADAALCQRLEDTIVHANNTHHTESCDGDEACVVNR